MGACYGIAHGVYLYAQERPLPYPSKESFMQGQRMGVRKFRSSTMTA